MIQDFYIIFLNKTHIKWLSVLLAKLAYFVYCIKYFLKKITLKHEIVNMSKEYAEEIVNNVWPEKKLVVDIQNTDTDPNIDLSIIIPVYNYGILVKDCINSVLEQSTSYNYELIIVDDGSKQETKDILLEYKDTPKVRLIFQENKGISGARNTGISNAKGKYLMFIDCDDSIRKNCVQVLLDEAYKKDCDIVMGAHQLVKMKDGRVSSTRDFIYSDKNLMNYKDHDEIMNYSGLPWGKVYKHELFNQIRFPLDYWYEDTITQFLLFRSCKKFSYVPIVIYEYKWYEGNYSKVQSSVNNRVLEHFWIVKKMIEENDRIGLPRDVILYKTVLRHLGKYSYRAIEELPEDVLNAVFVLSKDILKSVEPQNEVHFNYEMKELKHSFDKNDYALWKLVCRSL